MMITGVQVQGDSDKSYTVGVKADGTIGCTCPDHVFRQRECKHIRFTRATLLAQRSVVGALAL